LQAETPLVGVISPADRARARTPNVDSPDKDMMMANATLTMPSRFRGSARGIIAAFP